MNYKQWISTVVSALLVIVIPVFKQHNPSFPMDNQQIAAVLDWALNLILYGGVAVLGWQAKTYKVIRARRK